MTKPARSPGRIQLDLHHMQHRERAWQIISFSATFFGCLFTLLVARIFGLESVEQAAIAGFAFPACKMADNIAAICKPMALEKAERTGPIRVRFAAAVPLLQTTCRLFGNKYLYGHKPPR